MEPGGNFYRTFIHETGHGSRFEASPRFRIRRLRPELLPGIEATDPARNGSATWASTI